MITMMASQQLDLVIQVKRGYKLCDFRPAFGQIFEAELQDYDYWGHIDLDTFWGDMAAAINPARIKNPGIICGEISVYRDRQFYLQDSNLSCWIGQVQKSFNIGSAGLPHLQVPALSGISRCGEMGDFSDSVGGL